MGRRRAVDAADADYMGPAWEWAGDICHNHRCAVGVSVLPTRRAGVWTVRATAKALGEGPVTHQYVRVEAEWPNSTPQTLAGLIWALMMQLDGELSKTPIERAAEA